jgi:hypothetical protein
LGVRGFVSGAIRLYYIQTFPCPPFCNNFNYIMHSPYPYSYFVF